MPSTDVPRPEVRSPLRFRIVCAVLFDFDGTLIRQSIDFAAMRASVLCLAARYGVQDHGLARLPALEIVEAVARRLEDARAAASYRDGAAASILQVELEAAAVAAPYPGVAQALDALDQRGYAIGIVTRNCRRAVNAVLARHPLIHHTLVTRDDTPLVKPDPRHLYDAASRLGVPIARCLMCGDHPMDVAAGRAAGTHTAAVVYRGAGHDGAIGRDAFTGDRRPDLFVAGIPELLRHLPPRDDASAVSPQARGTL